MTIDTIFPGTSRDYSVTIRHQTYVVCNNAGQYARITNYVKEGVPQANIGIGPQPERTSLGPFIIGDTFTVFADIGAILVEYDNIPEGGGGDVTQSEFDTLQGQVTDQGAAISALQTSDASQATNISSLLASQATQDTTISSHTTSIGTLTSGLAAQVALEAADVADLQDQIDAIDVNNPGAITGLVAGGVTDNTSTFQGFLGPSENSGSIIAANGVRSDVPAAGDFKVTQTINVDPQIGLDWGTRGAITIIPDGRIPALTPGTYNSGIRTGGFAPASVFRMVRRSPSINKQAYEPTFSLNIDATGVKASGNFTSNGTATITSSAHGRQNGDVVFFRKALNGTALPAELSDGRASKVADSFKLANVTTNTFEVQSWNGTSHVYNSTSVTVSTGSGIWSTFVAGVRIPNNRAGTNVMDPDQDFDDKKEYTAGRFSDGDIVGMSGDGLSSEGGSGRLHIESFRALNCDLNGFDISSNDTVLSGHWGGGGNNGFTLKKGSGTGLYAVTGNVWGKPAARSLECGAIYCSDTAYYAFVANQPNDWCRFDADSNFNAAGVFGMNMMHPHAENYSSDGVGIDVQNSGDIRLQSNIGIAGYQGFLLAFNSWTRTETVKFDTPGNFGGNQTMVGGAVVTGTAPQYLAWFGANSGNTGMAQVFDGICTAPNVKPYQGPFATVTMTIASPCVVTWTAHPLVTGDKVFFHTTGALPTGLTADSVEYFVSVIDANTFNLTATVGGANINTTGSQSGTHTCYHRSSCPYYITSSSKVGGLIFDSYTGDINFWSRNGTSGNGGSGKALIQTNKNSPWTGNPNFQVEIGDSTVGSNLPKFHQKIYGHLELDYAAGISKTSTQRVTINNNSKTIAAYIKQTFFNVSGNASGTVVLPQGMTSSYELEIVFNGAIALLGWTATLNTNSPALPTYITGWTQVRLQYLADNDEWNLLSVSGPGVKGWNALTDAGTINTPALINNEGKFYVTLGGNRTLANPTSLKDGNRYTWRITQDGTGSRTLAFGAKFKFVTAVGAAFGSTISTAANAIDIIEGVYDALTDKVYCTLYKAYA